MRHQGGMPLVLARLDFLWTRRAEDPSPEEELDEIVRAERTDCGVTEDEGALRERQRRELRHAVEADDHSNGPGCAQGRSERGAGTRSPVFSVSAAVFAGAGGAPFFTFAAMFACR